MLLDDRFCVDDSAVGSYSLYFSCHMCVGYQVLTVCLMLIIKLMSSIPVCIESLASESGQTDVLKRKIDLTASVPAN